MIGFVYRWNNSINNKWYIGSHCGDCNDGYIGSGKVFLTAYKKHKDSFSREILYSGEHFRELEDLILATLDAASDRSSYNMKNSSIGGDTSASFTEESRRKMSEASKKKIYSEPMPEEQREKIRRSLTGRKLSEERKAMMSEAMIGERNHFFGKKHSAESRAKISKAKTGKPASKELMSKLHDNNKRQVMCIDNNIIFASIKETASFFNKSQSYISNILSGRCKNIYNIVKVSEMILPAGWEAQYAKDYCAANPSAAYCQPPTPPTNPS